jgi:hypothetical protein
MEIIAFTGKRGHGKSTAAEALVREHGYIHLNFADPLRQVCNVVYDVDYEEMLDPVLKEQPLTRWPFKAPRELLQQIGTDMFRNYIDDTWVMAWKVKVQKLLEGSAVDEYDQPIVCPGIVCSDCRFLNEAAVVESLGGRIIKIEDPRKVRTDQASLHQSEMEIDLLPFERIIVNDDDIAWLESAALSLVEG